MRSLLVAVGLAAVMEPSLSPSDGGVVKAGPGRGALAIDLPIVKVQAATDKTKGPGESSSGDPGSPEPALGTSRPDSPDDGVAKGVPRAPLQTLALFGNDDLIRIQAAAAKHGLLVPEFEFHFPAVDVPLVLRRMVGVWIDENGNRGKGRRTLLIVTHVEPPVTIHGFFSSGPPDATSFSPGPARYFRFSGTLDGITLRFQNPGRTADYSFVLTAENQLLYRFGNKKGQQTSRTLRPLWMLTLAERNARP
jgi:hypothetical protein